MKLIAHIFAGLIWLMPYFAFSESETSSVDAIRASDQGFDQPPTQRDSQVRLDDKIAAIESAEGAYGHSLTEALLELADFQFSSGDAEEAVETLRRGIHVARVNDGPHTPEQKPLVEKLLFHYFQTQNWSEVDAWLNDYYEVLQKNVDPSDPDWSKVYYLMAQWSMFKRYNGLYFPIEPGRPSHTSSSSQYWLARTEIHLEQIGADHDSLLRINRLRKQLFFSRLAPDTGPIRQATTMQIKPERTDIHFSRREEGDQLIPGANEDSINYFISRYTISSGFNSTLNMPNFITLSYEEGLEFFETWTQEMLVDPKSTREEQAEVLLSLGDWHLKFNKRSKARQVYLLCYQHFKNKGISAEEIEVIMNRQSPVILSTFRDLYFTHLEVENTPYIETQFQVSKWGRISNLDINDFNNEELGNLAKYLRKNSSDIRLRPKLVKGEPVKSDGHHYRIYLPKSDLVTQE